MNPYSNGTLLYTTIISDIAISDATLTFGIDLPKNGWGIDDVKVGVVAEPATIALMGLGLLGLGLARRKKTWVFYVSIKKVLPFRTVTHN